MANNLYTKAKESFLKGEIDWLNDNIRIALIDTGIYTVDIINHQYLSDVAPSSIVTTSGVLSGKSVDGGVVDATDVSFISGILSNVQAIIIYQDNGLSSTSRLIAYIDTGADLPFIQTASPVSVLWDEGANKIFKL